MAYNYKTEPYKHQIDALEKAAHHVEWAFFMDMGTGKTKTTIDNIGLLYHERKINSAVVVAPKSVYLNWEKEIDTHLPDAITRHIHSWNVTKNKKFDPFKNKLCGSLTILLINVEALSTKRGLESVSKFLQLNKHTFFVIDESTTIKNPQAKRTKNILALAKLSKYRRILTGSPVTKSPLDLYTQCAFLNPDLLGFKSYYSFRARYAEMHTIYTGPDRQIIVPKFYKNLDDLEFKLKQFSTRITKDECLDLPEKIYRTRHVYLGEKQRALYDKLKANAIAMLQDTTVSFTNKLTEILRLHQVCNGFINDDNGEKVELENPKMKELDGILDEIDGKVIIWANYIHNIEDISKYLKKKYGQHSTVTMYGATNVSARKQAIQFFQENPECRFFVANPQTGGHGLTLTAASYVIYFSNNYNLELRLQSEDRAHRIGQKKNVVYIDLIAKDTVDQKIVESLVNKNKISAETMGEEIKSWLSE
jgi:SNF2 family DNA or RNA helicase